MLILNSMLSSNNKYLLNSFWNIILYAKCKFTSFNWLNSSRRGCCWFWWCCCWFCWFCCLGFSSTLINCCVFWCCCIWCSCISWVWCLCWCWRWSIIDRFCNLFLFCSLKCFLSFKGSVNGGLGGSFECSFWGKLGDIGGGIFITWSSEWNKNMHVINEPVSVSHGFTVFCCETCFVTEELSSS